jgi:LysM repeat protein
VVRPGDTLSRLARAFGVSVAAIAQANDLTNLDRIDAGQVLQIPIGQPSVVSFWVENFIQTPLWSGTNRQAKVFSIAALFTPLQVLAPAKNGWILVRVWPTGDVAYVDGSAVGPAGPPKGA